jgi:hypothetical protein
MFGPALRPIGMQDMHVVVPIQPWDVKDFLRPGAASRCRLAPLGVPLHPQACQLAQHGRDRNRRAARSVPGPQNRRPETPRQRNRRVGTTAKRRCRPHQMDVLGQTGGGPPHERRTGRRKGLSCEPHHTCSSQSSLPPNRRHHMRKHISFTIAATIVGLAPVFWFKATVVETNADVARPKVDLSSNPYLSVWVL